MTRRRSLLALLAGVALVSGCGGGGGDKGGADRGAATTRVEVIESSGQRDGGFDPRAIYQSESPGVVTVVSLFGQGGLDSVLGGGNGGGGGVGSGFVLDGRGEIVTNAHVVTSGEGDAIRRAREVYVEFADGNQVPARIVGFDPDADVALLKVDPNGLTLRPLPLGNIHDVHVGQAVAAIGSPFGERQSLSVGVVSAMDRAIDSLTKFKISGAIQTDAAINPGNSGGPLVDGRGKVIGINQQIKTSSGGGEGVGFAVPVDVVSRSLEMLRAGGKATYAYLGVSSVALYPQLVDRFDLGVSKGAWVQEVQPGTPAADSGLKAGSGAQERFQTAAYTAGGDVITKLDGKPIDDPDDLAKVVAGYDPGRQVTLEVHRGGNTKQVKVKLAQRPANGG
jgi:S1-C subfamily serine protease